MEGYDQVVKEAICKIVHVILNNRVPQPSIGKVKTSKWFNLEMEESEIVNEELIPWRQNINIPIFLSIYFVSKRRESAEKVLLERWMISYELSNSKESVEVPTLYKKFLVLIRSLYIFVRTNYIYKIYQESKKKKLTSSKLVYELKSRPVSSYSQEHFKEQTFESILTPFGTFRVNVLYNSNTSFRELSAFDDTLMSSPYIISDYSGNDTHHYHNYSNSGVNVGNNNSSSSGSGSSFNSNTYLSSNTRPIPIVPNNTPSQFSLETPPSFVNDFPFTPPTTTTTTSNSFSPPPILSNSLSNRYSRAGSYKLPLISPFRESGSINNSNNSSNITNNSNLSQNELTNSTPIQQDMFVNNNLRPFQDISISNSYSSSAPKYPSNFIDQNNPFAKSTASISDPESEIGLFISSCNLPSPLKLTENIKTIDVSSTLRGYRQSINVL